MTTTHSRAVMRPSNRSREASSALWSFMEGLRRYGRGSETLDPTKKKQDDQNHYDQTQPTAWIIAQLRLCGHVGRAPSAIRIRITSRMVSMLTSPRPRKAFDLLQLLNAPSANVTI